VSKLETKGKEDFDALIESKGVNIFFIILYSGISFLLCLLVAVGYMKGYKNIWIIFLALLLSLYMLALFSSLYIKHKAYFLYLIHKNKKGDKSE